MRSKKINLSILLFMFSSFIFSQSEKDIGDITFVRQGVRRFVFDKSHSINLAGLYPESIIGLSIMHPVENLRNENAAINIVENELSIQSEGHTQTTIWLGGFNPFAIYTIDLNSTIGRGAIGFKFSDTEDIKHMIVSVSYVDQDVVDVQLIVRNESEKLIEKSISVNLESEVKTKGRFILQMLGSGLVLYHDQGELPTVIGQVDFNQFIDLRKKEYINSFHSKLYVDILKGQINLGNAKVELSSGMGLADIRAITYENGDPILDDGRLWYTMSIRGRDLPHHLQGVFSLDPTVFDLKLEGVVVFDHNDGLLRNEIASHIFYDRNVKKWRGITTGFSAYANPDKEKKQLLAIESVKDPRFGFSVMKAEPFGVVGNIEDPHILFDEESSKWRILTCKNTGNGYKAILLESDHWNRNFNKIAGPVVQNSTGTSIQKINGKRYCFSGSSEHKIFVYNYPDLSDAGILNIDLPPWNENNNSRVWPNVVELPDGYPFNYIALMMDRFNYPGIKGPNWTYGALYLYHGVSNVNQ